MSVIAIVHVIEHVLLTLWVGGLWLTGLVLAPVLFARFERLLAGEIAGRLFTAVSWVGLVCGFVLLVFAVVRAGSKAWRDWRALTLAVMLVTVLFGEFGLAARMRELKLLASQHADSALLWTEFVRLHGISSTLYLVVCVSGLLLVAFGIRPRVQAGN